MNTVGVLLTNSKFKTNHLLYMRKIYSTGLYLVSIYD